MDALRTLLLARSHLVVLDPDVAADAATRPIRDSDLDKFEDELAQLGFVMSLDLAMTIRRLPNQAIQELRNWIVTTLAKTLGAHRPHVPLFRAFPSGTPGDTSGLFVRRVLSWLLTRPGQPCPWCGEVKAVHALDPCGHLVCRKCWDGGTYAGCPICHRRVTLGDPFITAPLELPKVERVTGHDGQLRLVHLAFDLEGTTRQRFTQLVSRSSPLSPDDRAELAVIIDTLGPRVAAWLPNKIAVRETMAICVARLWMISPDRDAARAATMNHVRTATDILRVTVVLMGGNPGLDDPISPTGKLASIARGLRRCVLEALDTLEPQALVDDMRRHVGLWKRVGERLHPYELATRLPTAALAFAVVRATSTRTTTFGATLAAQAGQLARAQIVGDRVHISAWAGPLEDALRAGDARSAVAQLATRPGDLLRRADHIVRVAQAQQPEALAQVVCAIQSAVAKGPPGLLLTLGGHIAKRGAPWQGRIFFPKGDALKAWSTPDVRAPLAAEVIADLTGTIRTTLVARAEARPKFPRGVIDRGLVDLLVPIGERSAASAKVAWPRGSEATLPASGTLRLFLHWEEPPGRTVDLDLSVAFYDAHWRHVETCDFTNLVVGDRSAVHSGDLTSAPAPLGASEFVDLDLAKLAAEARYAVMVVLSYNAVAFSKLTYGFAGLMQAPDVGTHFDPRAVAQRFDLTGTSVILVPLTIDLEARRMRWIDVHVASATDYNAVGGKRAALAHLGKDFATLAGTKARPTLWDVAVIHAAARANVIYVREQDGTFTQYRRRDKETSLARLARLDARLDANEHDGTLAALPAASAPTWFALMRDDVELAPQSEGFVLDARSDPTDITRLAASDLVAQLASTSG